MEIEEIDEGDRQEEEVDRRPYESDEARLELESRQQVERPNAKRQEQRLDDDERLGTGDQGISRQQQQKDGREMVRQVRVRLRLDQAHRGFEEAALGRVPEDLVEDPEVRSQGVIGHVAQYRQDAVEDEVDQRQAGNDVRFEAGRQPPDVSDHERDL